MVHYNLISEECITGDHITVKCRHGEEGVCPLAGITLAVGTVSNLLASVASDTLQCPVLIGRDDQASNRFFSPCPLSGRMRFTLLLDPVVQEKSPQLPGNVHSNLSFPVPKRRPIRSLDFLACIPRYSPKGVRRIRF